MRPLFKKSIPPAMLLSIFFVFMLPAGAWGSTWPLFAEVQGGAYWHKVQKKESLYSIAGRFGSRWEYLARLNRFVPPYGLSVGQQILANNRHILPNNLLGEGLILNLPGHMLYLFQNGLLIKRYPVGIGKPDWPTPSGTFSVIGKVRNPIWTVPKSIQEEFKQEGKAVLEKVPPGPDNPLGKYWLPLSVGGYGIHATIWPESIGHSTSHGCIRMLTEDIEDLYERLKPGLPIKIVYEPLKMAVTADQKVFLEAHPNTYQKNISYWTKAQELASWHQIGNQINWARVQEVLQERNGIAEEVTLK